MALDINDMLIFLTVVEAGSFTLAADRLDMPKANVSRKVSRLEDRLGVRLLERTTRSQHLTEAGKRYLAHCKRIQEQVDLAEASVSELMSSYKGSLRIGTSVGIGQEILKPELGRFLHQHPELNLQLSLLNRRVDLIEEGFDMLIRVGQLDDSRLIAKRLGRVERKLYASPDYFKDKALPKRVDQLLDCDILMMTDSQRRHQLKLSEGNKRQQLEIQPRMLVDDFNIVRQSVLDGLGVAVFPTYMCGEAVSAGRLINILPEWHMDAVDVHALYTPHRVKIPKVRAFLDFILDIFQERLAQ